MRSSTEFEAVIGLECHVQLQTKSKAFSAASAAFGGTPNSQTDPYTLALPGTLPVLNEQAVVFAVRMGLACGSSIREQSRFARKHYFYPDLPKGYQITQQEEPLCEGGHIEFLLQGEKRRVSLNRIHLEEDAGKNLHLPGTRISLVDLNRAGVPLIEIVSNPDIRSAEEAGEYLRTIRQMVRFLGISDGNMEEGSLRCDANVSIRPKGHTQLGVKTELKNINSFKFVQKAIEHEIARQIDIVSQGGTIVSETRGWDSQQGTSHAQRRKEQANDYRYVPEPDLPVLVLSPDWIREQERTLPETPMQRHTRYQEELGLSAYDAEILTAEPALGVFFDQAVKALPAVLERKMAAKAIANWTASELLGLLNKDGKTIEDTTVSPEALAELVELVLTDVISGKTAKDVFVKMYTEGGHPRSIVDAGNLGQVTNREEIRLVCQKILADPNLQPQIQKYRTGQAKLFGFFVGLVMKETKGRAKAELVNELLKDLLEAKE